MRKIFETGTYWLEGAAAFKRKKCGVGSRCCDSKEDIWEREIEAPNHMIDGGDITNSYH